MIGLHHVNFIFVKANVVRVETRIIMVTAKSVISIDQDVRRRELTGRRKNWRIYD